MNYNEFLFCQLLQLHVEYYRELEYDLLFEAIPKLYKDFQDSTYNMSSKSEYECIEEYIKNNDIWYD